MNFTVTDLSLMLPEIFVLSMACIILIVDAYLPERLRDLTYQLSQGTLVGAAILTLGIQPESSMLLMSDLFISDAMSVVLKSFVYLIVFAVLLYSRAYLHNHKLFCGEYFVLVLMATLGMMVMISAHHLLTLYLGLELLSLSLYALVAIQRDSSQASEAAMKYFVLGALASGILLYGMSILYGLTGTLELSEIAKAIATGQIEPQLLSFALVFIIAGLAFKLGAVPFHMWLPDVYQGAPTAITLFIGSAPKLAAFAMVMRILSEALPDLHHDWQNMLIILAVLSIALGNIVAIAQTNIKRMLAYSTISHMGFLMLGLLVAKPDGYSAAMFYTIVYALMSMGGFAMLLLLSRAGFDAENLDDLKGLNTRSPWYAFIMMVIMLSMAGIPPFLGFWAKWAVLSQVVAHGFIWLAVLAVIFSVIGAFYYLRIVRLMYFEEPSDTAPLQVNTDMHLAVSVNGLAILALGILPQPLLQVCIQSIS
ncbi:NADH-quinone oxidoreductase subunit NuoN [Candidatus Venteria ishoeyi]|uniref:NADH-quinone oxidoreductase subunit N n=1 Tax=Candidatus Venteria ishoeyi TaxID=1899563 RepID=A0A1H6FG97_9GAMM|nr:NADH-quinone oxidoreductase subunit NuoN [Candidatus Venteria ishoeyi]SEH08024.1 NADH-quinone oxidoreductase subunit N [Candidatus Venteria ishoeyi]